MGGYNQRTWATKTWVVVLCVQHSWAMNTSLFKDIFLARMRTTQSSESMNAIFNNFVHKKLSWIEFHKNGKAIYPMRLTPPHSVHVWCLKITKFHVGMFLVLRYGGIIKLQTTASCVDGQKARLALLYNLMWMALKWMDSQMRYQALISF